MLLRFQSVVHSEILFCSPRVHRLIIWVVVVILCAWLFFVFRSIMFKLLSDVYENTWKCLSKNIYQFFSPFKCLMWALTEPLDLDLHYCVHYAADTWMPDWKIARMSRCTGVPNKWMSSVVGLKTLFIHFHSLLISRFIKKEINKSNLTKNPKCL